MREKFVLPEKPEFGSPCNYCGQCCLTSLCGIGKEVFGDEQPAPCPALIPETSKKNGEILLICFFVMIEKMVEGTAFKVEPIIQESLGIGVGCDADDFPETVLSRILPK